MARARNIKPGFFTNEDLVELPFSTRLLFIGLWTIADRAGRMEDKPKKIKMMLFPADDLNIDAALEELQKYGFLLRYEHGGDRFIQVRAFCKHQNPHKDEKASTIPAPCEHSANTVQTPEEEQLIPEQARLIPDSLNLIPDSLEPKPFASSVAEQKKHSPEKSDVIPLAFAEFWKAWPATELKTAKTECLKRWKTRCLESEAAAIVAHVTASARTKTWIDGFEPAPLTYINQKRWQDGPPVAQIAQGQPAAIGEDSWRRDPRFRGCK